MRRKVGAHTLHRPFAVADNGVRVLDDILRHEIDLCAEHFSKKTELIISHLCFKHFFRRMKPDPFITLFNTSADQIHPQAHFVCVDFDGDAVEVIKGSVIFIVADIGDYPERDTLNARQPSCQNSSRILCAVEQCQHLMGHSLGLPVCRKKNH